MMIEYGFIFWKNIRFGGNDKMRHNLLLIYLFLFSAILIGCSSVTKNIVSKQEWSENYSRGKNVKATSPLMIDGDPGTIGETQPPADMASVGATKFTEAVVELPEVKSIRKIVIRNTNLRNFIIYSGTGKSGDWKILKEFKNNSDNVVNMNVSTQTDKIKIRVLRTSDDETIPGGRGAQARLKHAPGKIQEIEIYGLTESMPEQATAQQITSTGEFATPVEERPKAPAITVTLETTQKSFPSSGPIPLKMNFKIGQDELIVLADHFSDQMLISKLVVKNPAGEIIKSSKLAPALSRPVPKRFGDKPVDVREARTLSPDSIIRIDVPNILDYYPIKEPGVYTIQFNTFLELHDKFVGREQTQKEDIERRIREINARTNYTATEKASLIQTLKEELEQMGKTKPKRYIEVGAKGKPFELVSNTLEITIQ